MNYGLNNFFIVLITHLASGLLYLHYALVICTWDNLYNFLLSENITSLNFNCML